MTRLQTLGIPVIALVFGACVKPSTEVQDTDTPVDTCVADIVSLSPADGTQDLPIATVIELQLSAHPGAEWSIEVLGVPGNATLAPNGLSAIFVPDAAFDYASTYNVTTTVCDTTLETTFSTIEEPVVIDPGTTFEMPFDSLIWHQPSSATVLATFVEFDSFLMEILEIAPNGSTFEAAFTAAWPGGEPECPSTVEIVADYSNNPSFSTEQGYMEIPVEDAPVPVLIQIDQLSFSGVFTDQGLMDDVSFQGRIDTRAFDPLLGGEGATCDLAVLAGDTCVACDDGAEFCLMLDVEVPEAFVSQGPGIWDYCGLDDLP